MPEFDVDVCQYLIDLSVGKVCMLCLISSGRDEYVCVCFDSEQDAKLLVENVNWVVA